MPSYPIQIPRPEGDRLALHFPAGARPGPTLVFLPGTGGTAAWSADETRLPDAAAKAGVHLVVAEAMRPDPAAPAKFLTNPPRWNDGSPPPLPELATKVDDVAFLNALFDRLISDGIANTIALAGFSNGAGMAYRFAAERADRVSALAPIAGLWWPGDAKPSQPIPTLVALGELDPLIPLRGGEVNLPWGHRLVRRPSVRVTLEAWAAAIGCEAHSEFINDGPVREEVFRGPVEFRVLTVAGLGHHWPGGRGQLNARIAGPVSDGLDLNPRLFEFIARSFAV